MIYSNCAVSMGMNYQIEHNKEFEGNQVKAIS